MFIICRHNSNNNNNNDTEKAPPNNNFPSFRFIWALIKLRIIKEFHYKRQWHHIQTMQNDKFARFNPKQIEFSIVSRYVRCNGICRNKYNARLFRAAEKKCLEFMKIPLQIDSSNSLIWVWKLLFTYDHVEAITNYFTCHFTKRREHKSKHFAISFYCLSIQILTEYLIFFLFAIERGIIKII